MMFIKDRRRDQKLDPDQEQEQAAGIITDVLETIESPTRQQDRHQ